MGMYYNKKKNKLYIDWDEKRSNGVEHWHGEFTPIHIYYHPKHPTQLYRVKVKGKMPKWVERFASHCKHKYGVTADNNGKQGFWITNWNDWESEDIPFSSPSIEGAINQVIKLIPDGLKELKDKLVLNKEIVKQNLKNNPHFFEDLGIYYKPETIEGVAGTLLIDRSIFMEQGDLTEEEYVNQLEVDGRLEKVIWEITTPLPEPIMEETEEEEAEELIFTDEDLLDIEELTFEETELEFDNDDSSETNDSLDELEGLILEVENDILPEIELLDEEATTENATEGDELEGIVLEEEFTLDDITESEEQSSSMTEVETPQLSEETTPINESLFETEIIETPKKPKKKKRNTKKKKEPIGETIPLF